jgi:hypothetical protein
MPTSALCWASVEFLSVTEDVAVFQRDVYCWSSAITQRSEIIDYSEAGDQKSGDKREEAEQDIQREAMWSDDRTRTSLMGVVHPPLQMGVFTEHRRASIHKEQVIYISTHGASSDKLWDTMQQAGRSRVRFPMRSSDFSVDLILTLADNDDDKPSACKCLLYILLDLCESTLIYFGIYKQ